MDMDVFSVRSLLAYARARRSATESAALWAGAEHHILRLRCRDAAVRAERARRSSPPRADRNDIDMGVHPVLAVSLRAREAERDGIGRALGPAPSIIFCGCGAGTRPFERSELGGLRRRERIATTSTWVFILCSLLAYARARRSATESAALWVRRRASYFAVAVPGRGRSSGAS